MLFVNALTILFFYLLIVFLTQNNLFSSEQVQNAEKNVQRPREY